MAAGFPKRSCPIKTLKRRFPGETDLSAEQIGAQAPPRLSYPHGDQGRPQGSGPAARTGAQEAERVRLARGRDSSFRGSITQSGADRSPNRHQSRNHAASMERLKRRTDFRAAAQAARAPAGAFVLQARQRAEDNRIDGQAGGPVRVGFTVSRQVGNAVERNRVRRRLREMVRLAPASALRAGHDYVLIGRRAALQAPFPDMVRQFDAALRRIHTAARSGQRNGPGSGQETTGGGKNPPPHKAGSSQQRHERRGAQSLKHKPREEHRLQDMHKDPHKDPRNDTHKGT